MCLKSHAAIANHEYNTVENVVSLPLVYRSIQKLSIRLNLIIGPILAYSDGVLAGPKGQVKRQNLRRSIMKRTLLALFASTILLCFGIEAQKQRDRFFEERHG